MRRVEVSQLHFKLNADRFWFSVNASCSIHATLRDFARLIKTGPAFPCVPREVSYVENVECSEQLGQTFEHFIHVIKSGGGPPLQLLFRNDLQILLGNFHLVQSASVI